MSNEPNLEANGNLAETEEQVKKRHARIQLTF